MRDLSNISGPGPINVRVGRKINDVTQKEKIIVYKLNRINNLTFPLNRYLGIRK
jgi:hypothetical protein